MIFDVHESCIKLFLRKISTEAVTRGQGREPPPEKLNVKTGPHLACISVVSILSILLIFSRLLFYVFFELFSADFGF